jgi:uncharacterized Ntn-hydrolase superfamily protein
MSAPVASRLRRSRGHGPLGLLVAVAALATTAAEASATWSIIAVDARTGQVVIASATCVAQSRLVGFPALGLMEVQAIVVPGVGVAAAQAGVDRTRRNQQLIHAELKKGTDPAAILALLGNDPDLQRRQFGIVDLQGRTAGFSGSENGAASLSVQGSIPGQEIHFSVQGNILASDQVVYEAVRRFMSAEGTLADRVMAAMEGADEMGGDVRCTCETEPVPDAPCHGRNAHVAYLLVAESGDAEGEGVNDGDWSLFIDVHDENILPHENANPVLTLRQRYGACLQARREGGSAPCRAGAPAG